MKELYELSVTSQVATFLRAVHDADRPVAKWLLDSLELLSADPLSGDTSVLSAELGLHRINVGDHKFIYQIDERKKTVVVLAAERRRGR